jgi:hypothetical protein
MTSADCGGRTRRGTVEIVFARKLEAERADTSASRERRSTME